MALDTTEAVPRGRGDALHRAVLDSALDAILTVDHEGRIVEFNPAAERTFGYRAEDVVGHPMAELIVPPDLREAHRSGFAGYLGGRPARLLNRRIEVTAMRAGGETFPAELAITRIGVEGPPLFTGHIRDITDRKLTEEELRRSRLRLVEAADEARRRLERDLHDGAQQRLIALGLDLRLLKAEIGRDPAAAGELLDEAIIGLGQAIDELRDLARGIHPAVLTERGLAVALPALVGRSATPVRVLEVASGRFGRAVEATAYFVVSEALANAARHADAEEITVAVRHRDGVLEVEVADDGRGGVTLSPTGSGLSGLGDRVAAQDGELHIFSRPGEGTRIVARLPCAS